MRTRRRSGATQTLWRRVRVAPRFIVPSMVWYGLDPAVPGPTLLTGTKPLSKWGGQLRDENAVRAVLLTLDSAILLLILAGYQVRTLVAGVPSAARQTAVANLVNVDLATMRIKQGSQLEWTDPDPSRADAQVALWVEPRYPLAPPGASGVTLDLSSLQTLLTSQGIDLLFSDDGTGWLRFSWAAGPGSWLAQLPDRVDAFIGAARDKLASLYAAAPPAASGLVVAGLLSIYDPATWMVSGEDTLPQEVAGFGTEISETAFGGGMAIDVESWLAEFLTFELPIKADQHPDRFGGVRPLTAAERFADTDARLPLDACADYMGNRALAAGPTAVTFATESESDVTALSPTELLLRWQEREVLDVLTLIAPFEDSYAGYDLRAGDVDVGASLGSGTATTPVYGGLQRTASAGDTLPQAGEIGYVAQLRRDLAELGFGPAYSYAADEANAQQFTVELEFAVREFQIAATHQNVAQQGGQNKTGFYADSLVAVQNQWLYAGPISGVVNAESRGLIRTWLNQQLRCPVVIEARINGTDHKGPDIKSADFTLPYSAPDSDNLWRATQVSPGSKEDVRMFVRNFSGSFALEPDNLDPENDNKPRALDFTVLGHFRTGGPWASPKETVWWHETEVSPEKLVGDLFSNLKQPSQRSTFRVVRSVADVECMGYFDVFSATDRGINSTGPYHWTIGLHDGNDNGPGELIAYFAYLSSLGGPQADCAHQAFYRYGAGVLQTWPKGASGPRVGSYKQVKHGGLWVSSMLKYQADVTLAAESGDPQILGAGEGARAEWFRQWHWCYRLAMAARTNDAYRRGMWDYARLRLADILTAPWPNLTTADANGKQTPATVGHVFTSELAVALLLRWHVNVPGSALSYDKSGTMTSGSGALRAFKQVHAAGWGDPRDWTDAQEAQLTEALYKLGQQQSAELGKTLPEVHQWGTSAWEQFSKTRNYELTAAGVSGAPVIKDSTGKKDLQNIPTSPIAPVTIPFTVDFKDVVVPRNPKVQMPTVKAASSDHAVAPDPAAPASAGGKAWKLTVSPAGKAGATQITITADNGAFTATRQFTVRFGPASKSDPEPVSNAQQGLSPRRDSYQLDNVGSP
jgi:hypothetical protein